MSTSKIMTGARAILRIGGKEIGIFSECSWSYRLDIAPAYVLGRYSVAETTYTGSDPVSVDCAGFRPVGDAFGPHQTLTGTTALVPLLADLPNYSNVEIEIFDRQSGNSLMKVVECKPTGYSTALRARDQETISISFVGKRVSADGIENVDPGTVFPGAI